MEPSLCGLLAEGSLAAVTEACAHAQQNLGVTLASENAEAERSGRAGESLCCNATLVNGSVVARGRIGASASRAQGNYGVNSVVYRAELAGQEYALKGIICAHGPFDASQEAALDQAVRDELRQPPYSPHLLRYFAHFSAPVEGDVAREWPADVQTTPVGSLAKWILMPLMPDGNLQAWVRAHPLDNERTLLSMLQQLLKAVTVLVDNGFLHRDIKLDNILVQPDGAGAVRLLLCDFGTMAPMANQVLGCTPGNPMKVSPELRTLQDIGPAAAAQVDLRKAEVWALGALAFDLVGSRGPYQQADSTLLPHAPSRAGGAPVVSDLTRALVGRMLAWDPAQRPEAKVAAAWVTMLVDQREEEHQVQRRRREVEAANAEMHGRIAELETRLSEGVPPQRAVPWGHNRTAQNR
jgi:serine/threonine protein kinase